MKNEIEKGISELCDLVLSLRKELDEARAQIADLNERFDFAYSDGWNEASQSFEGRMGALTGQIAELTKKANFNEGLRDVAMRDLGRAQAALQAIIDADHYTTTGEMRAIAERALPAHDTDIIGRLAQTQERRK